MKKCNTQDCNKEIEGKHNYCYPCYIEWLYTRRFDGRKCSKCGINTTQCSNHDVCYECYVTQNQTRQAPKTKTTPETTPETAPKTELKTELKTADNRADSDVIPQGTWRKINNTWAVSTQAQLSTGSEIELVSRSGKKSLRRVNSVLESSQFGYIYSLV